MPEGSNMHIFDTDTAGFEAELTVRNEVMDNFTRQILQSCVMPKRACNMRKRGA